MNRIVDTSKLSFHVIGVEQEGDLPNLSVVMLVGPDTDGTLRLWVDEYSTYDTEHDNEDVKAALAQMTGRVTPFYEAPDFIRAEWVDDDAPEILDRGKGGIEL